MQSAIFFGGKKERGSIWRLFWLFLAILDLQRRRGQDEEERREAEEEA